MSTSAMAYDGMVVTPHYLATQSAINILNEGGTAIEAAVAAAATVAVVYPHMNSIGGDGFWLIVPPHEDPFVIEACGAAGSMATIDNYRDLEKIPLRGPRSALTVAGAIGGWQDALNYVSECGYQRVSISRLLEDAIKYAENGCPVSTSLANCYERYYDEIKSNSTFFQRIFLPDGKVPKTGQRFFQKQLGETLKQLVRDGLDSFYRGNLADVIAEDMKLLGMPIVSNDLKNYTAVRKTPLRLLHSKGELLNVPPPAQGISSLQILGILDKLKIDGKQEGKLIHATVEATKEAFKVRNEYITDPCYMKIETQDLLTDRKVTEMAKRIDMKKASFVNTKGPGDTIWLGVMDKKGFSVSYIQSIYHILGSMTLLPKTGIIWHNRGVAFSLNKNNILALQPGKKPLHTLNPAAARLHDGRILVYGTRGGDGQPQTQAAIFHRYVIQEMELQSSVSAPRWVYGQTMCESNEDLKLENRFSTETIDYLKNRGHDIKLLPELSEEVGHAGILVRHPDGLLEGAFDPRGNGSAVGF